jgi:hypothetical protein
MRDWQARSSRTRSAAGALACIAASVAASDALLRPRIARWGATDAEVHRSLPGDDVIPGGRPTATNAVTIDAPPEDVWPWIVQIGRERAGFYTYTWIENLLGADIRNLDYIDPGLQTLHVGDRIWLTPGQYLGRVPGQFWRMRSIEPGYALVLEQHLPENPLAGTWALVVEPAADGRTRLLSRHCTPAPRGPVNAAIQQFWALGALLMERRMLLGVKERAEKRIMRESSREEGRLVG